MTMKAVKSGVKISNLPPVPGSLTKQMSVKQDLTHKERPHTHTHTHTHVQTSGGAEVFAGCSEASGPVDIDCCNSELVPSAGSDVGQLDALLCSLRDRWGESKPQGSGFMQGHSPM